MWSSVWININTVTLQHNKAFIIFIFYLMVLSMGNLQKRLIRAAFWVLLQAMFTDRLKTNGTAIKTTRETTNNQQKKYYSVKHIQRQQFSITKTSIKVSLKILSLQGSLSLCFKPASRCLLFSKMNSRHENRSKVFFYRQNYN